MDVDHQPRPMTGAERARKYRERRATSSAPSDAQFDRELRIVLIENVENPRMTAAMALRLVMERLSRRFSEDGVKQVIVKLAERR